jgi:predicted 2-oxoglutarate/Fe(II)-dependent dioxygenase YbiX
MAVIFRCDGCRALLLGADFIGEGSGAMDAALALHLDGRCARSLEDEALAALDEPRAARSAVAVGARLLPEGDPPLLYLARLGSEAAALRMLASSTMRPADALARDRFGATALHYAAAHGLPALARALLDAGARPDARTADALHAHVGERTPLHLAAACAPLAYAADVVALLLAARADARADDVDGASAAELAAARGASGAPLAALLARAAGEPAPPAAASAAASAALARACARDRRRLRLDIASRPLLHVTHVLPRVWGAAACARVRRWALDAARARGWASGRHAHYPTVDLPLWRAARALRPVLKSVRGAVLPAMADAFGLGSAARLRVREAFFVQYSAAASGASPATGGGEGGRDGLELHRDGTLLSCNVTLNAPCEFEGGGTCFAASGAIVRAGLGDFVLHSGQLLHGAAPVTRGRRLILVFFIDALDDFEADEADEADEEGEDEWADDDEPLGKSPPRGRDCPHP